MKNDPLTWWRTSGCGNTFFICDHRSGTLDPAEKRKLTTRLCGGDIGLSADGVIFLENARKGGTFAWDFFNADGSSAEMCGNAARCAALFFSQTLKMNTKNIVIETIAGDIGAQILSQETVEVVMTPTQDLGKMKLAVEYSFVNTGVPHLVREVSFEFGDLTLLREEARVSRRDKALGAGGSNVTYFCELAPGKIRAVSFERGVEDFTQACGTGAVAAAIVYAKAKGYEKVAVQMPGGILSIDLSVPSRPKLTGPVEFQFQFQLLGGEF